MIEAMEGDNNFGPRLPGTFDFTLLFEQSILCLVPKALFILLVAVRLGSLFCRDRCMRPGRLLWSKLLTACLISCLQVALLLLCSRGFTPRTTVSFGESIVAVVESLAIGMLSFSEHIKSPRPSALLSFYLVLTIIIDASLARSLWIRQSITTASLSTGSIVCKVILLVLEEGRKAPIHNEALLGLGLEGSAGVANRAVFWWLNGLFYKGSRDVLDLEDLPKIEKKFDSELLLKMLEDRWATLPHNSQTALLRCTFWAYRRQFLAGIIPRLLYSGFTFAQPFLIRSIIEYVGRTGSEDHTDISLQNAGGLIIGVTAMTYLGLAITGTWHKHMSYQLVTLYRGGLVSLIFKKTLRLKALSSSVGDNAPVTLMTTDIDNIVSAGESLHNMWASIIELPIGIYLLYRQVGLPSLFVLVPTIVTTLLSGRIAPAMEPATVAWNQAVQVRVGQISGLLAQIKGIKMMGLTDYFHILIRDSRIKELKISNRFRGLQVALTILATSSSHFTPVIIIISCIYWTEEGDGLGIAHAFTSISTVSLVTSPLLMILTSMMSIAGVFGAFIRLQKFLLLDEQKDNRLIVDRTEVYNSDVVGNSDSERTDVASLYLDMHDDEMKDTETICFSRFTNGTTTSQSAITIQQASFTGSDGAIILHDITLTIHHGTLNMITGRVGCGKSSLLKAIIGESSPVKGTVMAESGQIAYCDQTPWLQNMTIQENIVGPSTVDKDFLSAVIRACALDEDVLSLPRGLYTVVGSGGVALSGGQRQRVALARAVYCKKTMVVIDDAFSGLDNKTANTVIQRLLGPDGLLRRSGTTIIMSTSNVQCLPVADYITMLEQGCIIHNQISYESIPTSKWGSLESGNDFESGEDESDIKQDAKELDYKHDVKQVLKKTDPGIKRQSGDAECYKIYFGSIGRGLLAVVLGLSICHAAMSMMPHIWLKLWVEDGGKADIRYTLGYISVSFATVFLGGLCLAIFLMMGIPKSANHLHEGLLSSVCRAPLYFFTTTESGTILNRFSQDMTLVDQKLPMAFYITLELGLKACAQTGVIASGATYTAAFIPIALLSLYIIQKFYLHTSRQMRLLDLEAKSPLYTHFTETLAGLPTVRAYGWSDAFLRESLHRLDTSQRSFYLMFCIQRWLQVVLALLVAGMAVVLVSLALHVSGSSTQGSIGLSMVNLLGFNQTLAYVINYWTQLETSLGAISRLREFVDGTPDECEGEEREVCRSDKWPVSGEIEFENVTAGYIAGLEPVLRDVSLKIKPGQRVCVCGRSGSGKSSLVLALLRMLNIQSGRILIDGVDLTTFPRQHIRSHMTSIPQDPVQAVGTTVRQNLNPWGRFKSYDDKDMVFIEALRKTDIWHLIESRGGLDADFGHVGLSAGQRQLFCLARSMLFSKVDERKHGDDGTEVSGRVVLMDEATSCVDRKTDEVIRRIVRTELAGSTVVEVLHRLEIVREFDVVVVMGHGRVVEVGSPEELLSGESELRKLLREMRDD